MFARLDEAVQIDLELMPFKAGEASKLESGSMSRSFAIKIRQARSKHDLFWSSRRDATYFGMALMDCCRVKSVR